MSIPIPFIILACLILPLVILFFIKQKNRVKAIINSNKEELIKIIKGAQVIKSDFNLGVMPADIYVFKTSILIIGSYPIQIVKNNENLKSFPIQQLALDSSKLEEKKLILKGNLKQVFGGSQTKLTIKEIQDESLELLNTVIKENYS